MHRSDLHLKRNSFFSLPLPIVTWWHVARQSRSEMDGKPFTRRKQSIKNCMCLHQATFQTSVLTVAFVICCIGILLPWLFFLARERTFPLFSWVTFLDQWPVSVSCKGLIVNIFGFAGHMVSVAAVSLPLGCKANPRRYVPREYGCSPETRFTDLKHEVHRTSTCHKTPF